jgi:two-component system nitrogen regulation response regulator NtrX
MADGGTLFLDEVADMSLNTQAKVLRVLQEQRFQRVGGQKTVHVDVRVISATNKDLEKEIEAGRFREDLFFRLGVIPIRIPPLRERVEDIPELCHFFIDYFAKAYGRPAISFTAEALRQFQGYHWRGNVRELRNIIERLMIMSRKAALDVADLPENLRGTSEREMISFAHYTSLKEAKEDFEKRLIEYHLRRMGGHITNTAEVLQLERSNLSKKIKHFQIDISRFT